MGDKFNYKSDAKQLVSFENMPIRLSDIDGCYDHYGKAMLYFEIKRKYVALTTGQRILLERSVKNAYHNGVWSIAIIGEHEEYNRDCDIDMASCIVREYKINDRDWRQPKKAITVGKMTETILQKIDSGEFK